MGESSGEDDTWIQWFCGLNGHEMFCQVDKSYIADSFNLYGLRNMVSYYSNCIDIILDQADESDNDSEIQQHAMDLYGLIHARFILTTKGLSLMKSKYDEEDFGYCPRTLCEGQSVVPAGTHDDLNVSDLRVFCPKCQELYNIAVDTESNSLDGAYFGTTFPHLFFLVYPCEDNTPIQSYVPRVFGYKIYNSNKSSQEQQLLLKSNCQVEEVVVKKLNKEEDEDPVDNKLPDNQNLKDKKSHQVDGVTDIRQGKRRKAK